MSHTVGIILTGGASRRMGVDKATMTVDGKPMVVRVADALWEAGLHPVECQGGDVEAIEAFGLLAAADPVPGAGPLAAIRTALARHPESDAVVVAVDLVDVDCATIKAMVDAAAGTDVDVMASAAEGRHHLLSWWRAGTAAKVSELLDEGVEAYQQAIERLTSADFSVDVSVVRNVNTPDDLAPDE